jgi:hypothetical protein
MLTAVNLSETEENVLSSKSEVILIVIGVA